MIKKILQFKFIRASFWMFVGTGFLNIGNYLYHVVTGRMLGKSGYGELESLISLLYIFSIPMMTLTIIIVKFVSDYKGKSDISGISKMYHFLRTKIIIVGGITSGVLFLFSPFISSFLHLSSPILVLLLVVNFFVGLLSILNKSVLQGISDFFGFSVTNLIETFSKLLLAICLIFLGYKVEGAFGAVTIGAFIGYLIALYFINKLHLHDKGFTQHKQIFHFSIPAFITTLSITSLITTDVILARHFLPASNAGDYAALSVLGKIIFFGVSPIMLVMFPFVSEHHARGQRYSHFLFISFGLTFAASACVLLIYFLFPSLMVHLLFGQGYIQIVPYLGIFGIFIALYSLSYLLANFFLSIHKTFIMYIVAVAAITQIIGIYLFHSTIIQLITINTVITFLLLLTLLLYYPYAVGKIGTKKIK
ncbi:MAG TPA: oligosaccharide flippase family protein [Candidatus Saccharimonadales bacterium]|nr:oligosaccharide flippase family protein [Candidatus Saccharimonadales bacterium]